MFISLAITCLLAGLVYIYVRQELSRQNAQIEQLTLMVKCFMDAQVKQEPAKPRENFTRVVVSDDSESSDDEPDESADESEDESVVECPPLEPEWPVINEVAEVIEEISTSDMTEVKHIELAASDVFFSISVGALGDVESLNVKELKAKVAEMGGPSSLKKRNELIEYIKNKDARGD